MRVATAFVLLAVTLAVLVIASGTTAETLQAVGSPFTETVTLVEGAWKAYRTDIGIFESWHVTIHVVSGSRIDVYTTNELGYGEYTDPNSTTFDYYPDGSMTNVTDLAATFPAPTSGTYYVIVDNTRITQEGAMPTGAVTVHVALEKSSLVPVLAGSAAGIAAVIVGAILYVRMRPRKRRVAKAPAKTPSQRPPESPPTPPAPPGGSD